MKKNIIVVGSIFILLGVYVFITKPYIKEYELKVLENKVLLRENIITKNYKVLDSKTLSWVDKDIYLEKIKININSKFDELILSDYGTVEDIFSGRISDYEFIPIKTINELINKELYVSSVRIDLNKLHSNDKEYIAKSEQASKLRKIEEVKTINRINKLVETERLLRLSELTN